MFSLVASSLGYLRNQRSIVCGSSLQRGYSESVAGSIDRSEIGVGLQQMSVTGSKAGIGSRIRTIANDFADHRLRFTAVKTGGL